MKIVLLSCALYFVFAVVSGFWDEGTSTPEYIRTDTTPRQSFFRWQETQPEWRRYFFWGWDWAWLRYNRRLNVVAGLSYQFICIGTGTILNRRTLLTACNLLEPFFNLQRDLRIWALGSYGEYNTPYRYRVWRVTRLFPKSLNPEQQHGLRGIYSPRHDVCVIHSLDQMMTLNYVSTKGHYPHRSYLVNKHQTLSNDLWFTGSGYEYLKHIKENYKIFITKVYKEEIIDCSIYLPKYWGKFICVKNTKSFPGVQNGGGFHTYAWWDYIAGLGCFEIRYNDDRVFAFTDLRYYYDWIVLYASIYSGEYYEYAYPHWGMWFGIFMNSVYENNPRIPAHQFQYDLYPLGKK